MLDKFKKFLVGTFSNRRASAEEDSLQTAGNIIAIVAIIAIMFSVVMFGIVMVNKSKVTTGRMFGNLQKANTNIMYSQEKGKS